MPWAYDDEGGIVDVATPAGASLAAECPTCGGGGDKLAFDQFGRLILLPCHCEAGLRKLTDVPTR